MKEWFKRLIRRALGWYIDPICQANEQQQAQLEQQQTQIEQQQIQIEQQQTKIEQQALQLEQLQNDRAKDPLPDRLEQAVKRIADIEQREEWTRGRFEGHDQRIADIEQREDWTRGRFEGHDQRIADIERRENWTRKRFEGHDEKIYEMIRWNAVLEDGNINGATPCILGEITSISPSRLCTAQELLSAEYQQYRDALKIDDFNAMVECPHYSRKEWEFESICFTLDEFGMLAPGKTGIGFAVGQEPLSAYFALRGCTVLASDLAPEMDTEGLWSNTNQNALGDLNSINRFGICPPDEFKERVSYRNIDMNDIPNDLGQFDFCWSTCAIEHIGTLGQSILFLQNMLNILKPGGVAVHTTEINLSSNISTIEKGNSVIFRDRDVKEVYDWMTAHGHQMSVDLTRGSTEMDLRRPITGKKYTDYMLNCNIEGYDSTSFVFIIKKNTDSIK